MPGIIIDGDSSLFERAENIEIRDGVVRHGFVTLKDAPENTIWIEAVHPKDLPTFDGPLYQVDHDEEQDALVLRQVQIRFGSAVPAPIPAFSLEDVLREAFEAFYESLSHSASSWYAKERDCVNRFVMGHLVRACSPGSPLEYPAQIGMEVAVKMPDGMGSRLTSPKDVVIWDSPHGTCWSAEMRPTHAPMAVLEWKSQRETGSKQDTAEDCAWLQAFCEENPASQGYSVLLDWTPDGRLRGMTVKRCTAGKWNASWLLRPC